MHYCQAFIDPHDLCGSIHIVAKPSQILAISVVHHGQVLLHILSACSDAPQARSAHCEAFLLDAVRGAAEC